MGFSALDVGLDALIDELLDKGADINQKVKDGKTVLHLAVEKYPEYTVKLLLDRNANPIARDDNGNTPYAIAAARGDQAASGAPSTNTFSSPGANGVQASSQVSAVVATTATRSAGVVCSAKLTDKSSSCRRALANGCWRTT